MAARSPILPAGFTHLEVHSHFTLLGATAAPATLAARAAAAGLPCLALTDDDALYGAVAFSRACRQEGIRPILGLTAAVRQDDAGAPSAQPGRLVLLATGPAGYRSLCRLTTWLQGNAAREARRREGLPWSLLEANREGLLAIDAGRRGWVDRLLRAGDPSAAAAYAARLAGLFGADAGLGLERRPSDDPGLADDLRLLAARLGLPLVALLPIYCLEPDERELLPVLAAMDRNCPVDALPPEAAPPVEAHWPDPTTLAARYTAFPEALDAAAGLAARCQPALPGSETLWPALPAAWRADLPAEAGADDLLASRAWAGLAARYPAPPEGGEARLAVELEAITARGFAPLFLLVADIVRFARDAGIPVNTRGSVANSLVAYCLGITTVDPLAHELLFERFLSPARQSLPDIDLDFCSRRRDEVLAYVRRTHGADRVALVATVSTLRLKSAVRETGKALGLDETALAELARALPRGWHPDPRRRDTRTLADIAPTLADARHRAVVLLANRLVGQPHHLSIHPGGIVIAPGPLTDRVPLQWTAKGFLITQFDHVDVEAIGLPKIDLLGIRALTVMADAAELVRRHHDPDFRLEAIPANDQATGELLAVGDSVGVFQCESAGARRTLRQLRARSVRDLAVANAFFKPGPALGGMAAAFVRRYRGEEPVTFLHPALAPILAPTQGVLLFQEQIMRLAREVAGLGWAEADQLRRGMSKFDAGAIAALREQFVAGCQEHAGLSRAQAARLWEQVEPFAGYGFNQGHATAYADVSYRSAYLKTHWPAAFLCARLADYGGFHHPAIYIEEARRLGIAVRPPHVNHSGRRFTLGWEAERAVLWMGLGQVRDLRRAAIRAILAARARSPFADLRDLLARVRLHDKEIRHLVQAGALDGLGPSRAALLADVAALGRAAGAGQLAFDFGLAADVPAESAAERLAWERRILGQPVSIHPLALAPNLTDGATSLRDLPATRNVVAIAGTRLPGWTGGKGFFFGDGETFITVQAPPDTRPPLWAPRRLVGHWRPDAWGDGWFAAERVEAPAD